MVCRKLGNFLNCLISVCGGIGIHIGLKFQCSKEIESSNLSTQTIDSFVAFGITITDKKQPCGKKNPSFTKLPDSLERQAQALDLNG